MIAPFAETLVNRRSFLLHSTELACVACLSQWAGRNAVEAMQEEAQGCSLILGSNQFAGLDSRTFSSSGNRDLDKAMIAEIRKVDRVFGITPGYRYLDDRGGPNAYATTESLVPGTQGTILFGQRLVASELLGEFGGAGLAGIAAHEGAHIFQFTRGFSRRLRGPTAKLMELHADYLAGFYFSQTGRTQRSLVVFHESLFAKGDFHFNDENHHGTPQERVSAMRAGYLAGTKSSDLNRIANQGVQHVS